MADFFDKMLVGINKGVNTVSEGSKALLEKAKLNTGISDAEKEKQKIAAELGMQVFGIYKSGETLPEALIPFCEQIAEKDGLIAEMREKLAALDAPKEVPAAPAAPQPQVGSYCPECGSPCSVGAKFCPKCGKTL